MARTMEEIEEEIRKAQQQRRQGAVQGSGNTAGQSQMNSQEIEEQIRAEQKKRTQEYSRNRAKLSFGGPTQDIYQGREHLYHAEGTNHFIDPKATDYRAQGNNLLNNQLTQADTDRLSYQQTYDFLSDAAKESLRQYQKYQDLSINPTVDDATRKKAASSAKYINDTYDAYLGEDGFRQFLNYKKEADNAMTVDRWDEKVKDAEEQGPKTLTEEQEKRLYELWNQQADAQTAFAAKEGLEELKKELVKSGWTDQEAEDVLAEGKVSDPTRTPKEELEYASDYINQTLNAEQKATLQRYLEARTNIGESMAALQGGRANGTQYDPDDMQRAKQALLDSGLEEEELSRLVQYGQELNDYYDRLEQQQLAYDQTHTGSGFKDVLGGIKNSVDAVLVSPAAGFLSIGESLNRGNYPDQAAPVNTNSRMYTLTNLNTDLKAATAQRISETPAGELGAKAYQVGMSVGESAFGTWMGGKLGALTQAAGASEKAVKLVTNLSTLPSFGANAYAVTLQEAQERGIDTDDAVATALVAGLAEMATEVWSLDHFWDIAKSQGTKAARNAVIDVLVQAGVEGSEEVASDLINRAADAIINGDESAYNQSVREYISQGMTEEEAKQKATKEAVQGTVESFLGGAASGGIMGSAAQGVKLVTDTQSAKQMFADGDYQSFAEAIDTEERSYTNRNAWETAKEAQALARDYAARVKEGESIRTQEQRKLYNLVMDTAEIESGNRKAEANAAARQRKKAGQRTRQSLEIPEQTYEKTDVPKEYQSQGISESEMFDRMAQAQTAEELTEAYKSGRETADDRARRLADNAYQQYSGKLLTEGKATQAELDAALHRPTRAQAYLEGANGTAQDALDLTDETRIAYNEGVRRRTEELASRTVQNAEDIQGIRIRGVGQKASVTYNQATVSAEDFRAKSFGVQTLVHQALNQNTEAAANGYLAHYPAGVPITSYTKAFQTFYDAGAAGVKSFKETMKRNRYMSALVPESTLESIFALGGKELSIKDQTAVKTSIREGTGTVKDLRTNKTQEVALLPVYEAYAKATGTTIVLKDDMDAHINGSFQKAASEIVFNTGSDKAFSTFFHEAVGEYTQAWNAEGMKEVQEAILSYVVDTKGAEYLSRTGRRYQSAYMAQEGTKSFREAMDEYVNDGISGLFTSKEGMRQFAQWLDSHQKASKRNVLQKLADWIKNVVDSLKKALTGSRLSEATKTVAEMNIERANKLRTQILDALSVASEHQAKAAKTGDLTDAEVKYSLEVAEGTTLEERIQDAMEHPKEQSHIYIQDTPKSLQDILGIGDLPMLMTSNHIYSVVKTAEEAKKEGNFRKRTHYHGLGEKTLLEVFNGVGEPAMIVKSTTDPDNLDFVVFTTVIDAKGIPVMVAVHPNGTGNLNCVEIDTNVFLSAYGRSNTVGYIDTGFRENRILYVDQTKSQQMLQSPGVRSADELLKTPGIRSTDNLLSADFTENLTRFQEKVKENRRISFDKNSQAEETSAHKDQKARIEAVNAVEDIRFSLDVDLEQELKSFGVSERLNDYVGVQKAVIGALREEGFFDGNMVTNEETGMEIAITPKGIKETLGNGKRFQSLPRKLKELKVATVRSIPDMVRTAKLIEDNVENSHGNKPQYAYFESIVQVNGEVFQVTIDVRKSENRQKFWMHNLTIEKSSGLLAPALTQELNETRNSTASITESAENATTTSDIRHSLDINEALFDALDGVDVADEVFLDEAGNEQTVNYQKDSIREAASILEEGNEALKGRPVNQPLIRRIASSLLREYDSAYDRNTFASNLEKVFSYMQTQESVDFQDMLRVMKEVASPVVEASRDTASPSGDYQAVKEALSSYRIALNKEQKAEVVNAFGSYQAFKAAVAGRIHVTERGTALDSLWGEITEQSLGILDPMESSGNQPLALYDLLEQLKPQKQNEYGGNNSDAAYDLALQIVERYYEAQGRETGQAKAYQAAKQLQKKNAEYRSRVRTRYQERLKKARKEIGEHYQERISRLRSEKNQRTEEQLARLKARHRQSVLEANNRRKASGERVAIIREAHAITEMLLRPTDAKHVPENMKKQTIEFIQAIDLIPKRSKRSKEDARETVRWQEKMRGLQTILNRVMNNREQDSELEQVRYVIDPDTASILNNWLERNRNTPKVSQMEYEDLHELRQVLRSWKAAISKMNKNYKNARYESVQALGTASFAELNRLPRAKDRTKAGSRIHELLNIDMLDPFSYFEEMGEASNSVFREIREGFDTRVRHLKETNEYMKAVVGKTDVSKWTGDKAEVETFHTAEGDIRLTAAQVMSLYELAKRPQAEAHILVGGIKADVIRMGRKEVRQARAVHVSRRELQEITGSLNEEQRQIADAMQEYMGTQCAKWGNNVSMQMYGYEKFTEEHYFPIKVDKNTVAVSDKSEENASYYAVQNISASKALTPKANNPLMLQDIFDVFTDHVVQMATYDAFAMPISDAMRWINYKEVVSQNKKQKLYASMQEEMDAAFGPAWKQYFKNFIKDINGMSRSSYGTQYGAKFMSNYKAHAVGANFRVVVQQPTAYLRAAAVMNPKYLAAAVPSIVQARKLAAEVKEKSMAAWWKSQGYYDTSIGRTEKQILTGIATTKDKIRDAATKAAGLADDLTWGVLYQAVKLEQAAEFRKAGKTTDSQDYQEACIRRFDDVIDHTQVIDSLIHRSQFMRSTDFMAKMETAFMAEPTKSYNMLHRAQAKTRQSGTKRTNRNYRFIARAAATYVLTNLLTSAVAAVVDAFRDDEEEKKWLEKWMESFGSNAIDNINPMNMIPFLKEISSGLSAALNGTNYSQSRMDIDGITSAVTILVKDVQAIVNGSSKKTPYGMFRDNVKAFSMLTGIPAYGALREAQTWWNALIGNQAEDLKLTTKQPSASEKKKQTFGEYLDAVEGEEDAREAMEALMDQGYHRSEILSALRSEYAADYRKADEEERKSLEEKLSPALETLGEDPKETLSDWVGSSVTYEQLDTAMKEGDGIQEAVAALVEAGKDPESVKEHLRGDYAEDLAYRADHMPSTLGAEQAKAQKALEALGYDQAEVIVRNWTHGYATTSGEKYGRLFDAVESGDDYQGALKEAYTMSGGDTGNISSALTRQFKERLVESRDVTLLNRLLAIYMALGKTKQEAQRQITRWFTAEG